MRRTVATRRTIEAMAEDTAMEAARHLGCTPAEALVTLRRLGAVIEARLQRGRASGIPGIGTIGVEHEIVTAPKRGAQFARKGERVETETMKRGRVRFRLLPSLRRYVGDHAPDTGGIREQVNRIREQAAASRGAAGRGPKFSGGDGSKDWATVASPYIRSEIHQLAGSATRAHAPSPLLCAAMSRVVALRNLE